MTNNHTDVRSEPCLDALPEVAVYQRMERTFLRLVADVDGWTVGFREDFVDFLLLSTKTTVLLVPDDCVADAWLKEVYDLGANPNDSFRFLAPDRPKKRTTRKKHLPGP